MRYLSHWLSSGLLVPLGLLAGSMSDTHAADLGPPPPAPVIEAPAVPGWTYLVTPYGWLISLNGTQTVRGRSVKVDASFIDIVEESDTLVALMGDFEARNGPFALLADVVWTKIGVEGGNLRSRSLAPGVTGTLGTSLNLDIEMAIAEVGAAYEVARSGPIAFDILAGRATGIRRRTSRSISLARSTSATSRSPAPGVRPIRFRRLARSDHRGTGALYGGARP